MVIWILFIVKIQYNNWKSDKECIRFISKKLIPLMKYIEESEWMGLPEMTDENGKVVKNGNETHLMAICIIYEVLDKISKKNININNNNN